MSDNVQRPKNAASEGKNKTTITDLSGLDSIIEKLISVTNFWISRSCLGSLSVLSS